MKTNRYTTLVLLGMLAFGGCGPSAEPLEDAGAHDAAADDAAQQVADGGPADAAVADDGGAHDGGAHDGGVHDGGADGGGEGDAGPACGADEHACDGECVPASRACGVPIPDGCTTSAECGAAGECIDTRCVCAEGHRTCAAGCCPVRHRASTLSLPDLKADSVQLTFGADGTAYILLQVEVSSSPSTAYELRLYTRAATPGAPIVRTDLAIAVDYQARAYSFGVRSDGTLFIAVAPAARDISLVVLHQWAGGTSSSETLGYGYGYDPGVSLTIADDDTVWVTWSRSRSGGLSVYTLAADGVARAYQHSVGGMVQQTDVEQDPASGGVYSFWGHRYTGSFVSGVVTLSEHPDLALRCPADYVAFDSLGGHWAVSYTHASGETQLCRDAMALSTSEVSVRGSLPPRLPEARLAVDGEDAAFVTFYETDAYEAHWLASTDGERWARGVLPVRYGIPSNSTGPAAAYTDVARRPDGPVSVVVAPRYGSMGPLTLVDFE